MLSVFIDTMLICTATAFMCLSTNVIPQNYLGADGSADAAGYVQAATASTLGKFGPIFIAFAMCLFAFTTLIGNYSYCEGCIRFIIQRDIKPGELLAFRLFATALVFVGSIASAGLVWNTADMMQGLMVITNMPTILLLGGTAVKCLRDYQKQKAEGRIRISWLADIETEAGYGFLEIGILNIIKEKTVSRVICTLFPGHPGGRVFLCAIVMSLN